MNVIIDKELCVGCGLCVYICPEVFEIKDNISFAKGLIYKIDIPVTLRARVKQVATDCPAEAIKINDKNSNKAGIAHEAIDIADTYIGRTCPYCMSVIRPNHEVVVCPVDGDHYHKECWEENGNKCPTYGCKGKVENNNRRTSQQDDEYSQSKFNYRQNQQSLRTDQTPGISVCKRCYGAFDTSLYDDNVVFGSDGSHYHRKCLPYGGVRYHREDYDFRATNGPSMTNNNDYSMKIEINNDEHIGKTCPYCMSVIKPNVEVVVCPLDGIPHHKECWEENGNKCTTYGCKGKVENNNQRTSQQDDDEYSPPQDNNRQNQQSVGIEQTAGNRGNNTRHDSIESSDGGLFGDYFDDLGCAGTAGVIVVFIISLPWSILVLIIVLIGNHIKKNNEK